ncbi:MAG: HupE/UreJ family protein [Rhodospirillaceae bacterium]|nr:HupE/UreJ family protein [Rhodospirillaceae bacterium]
MKRFVQYVAFLVLFMNAVAPAMAHESMPAYLGVVETAPSIFQVSWRVPSVQGPPPPLSPELPQACVAKAPPEVVPAPASIIGRWTVACDAAVMSAGRIEIKGLEHTVLNAVVRIEFLERPEIVHVLRPVAPAVDLADEHKTIGVAGYFHLGVEHILLGIDHLLFVLGLVLTVRDRWALLKTVTAFTIAHSLTLAAASLGLVHVPGAPVEAIIALSIIFLALELTRIERGMHSLTQRMPWLVAFSFGLLHGFGFAGALSEIGLPQDNIPLALLLFNLGVEAGQLLFVAALLLIGTLVLSARVTPPRWLVRLPPYSIGAAASFWFIERLTSLLNISV